MRILIHAVDPRANSGNGKVTRSLIKFFRDHEVWVASQGAVGTIFEYEGARIIPQWRDPFLRDILPEIIRRFNPDVIIRQYDIWGTTDLPAIYQKEWIAYIPIDFDPVPSAILKVLRMRAIYVPFTWDSKKIVKNEGVKVWKEPIYHHIPTDIYKPMDKEEMKKKFKLDGYFVVGNVAIIDGEIRKGQDFVLEAFRKFLDLTGAKDARLLIHGFNEIGDAFVDMIKFYKLKPYVIKTDPLYSHFGLDEYSMVELYNAMDVFLNLPRREGFGIAPQEAQACGVPAIQPDWLNTRELTHPDLKVRVKARIFHPIGGGICVPDTDHAAEILADLYENQEKIKKYGKWARKFVKDNMNFKVLKEKWDKLLESI